MTFTTLTFFLLLAVVFGLYWSLRDRMAQNVLLVVASYVFYGWWDWRFCWLMFASSMLDYFVGLSLERSTDERRRKWLLAVGMCGNLGLLGYFKYSNFFAENFRLAAEQLGWQVNPITINVILPVGISFYTFQTMCYSIDIYRRQLKATTHLVEYLAYVSFFPQLVAGPIERATNLLPQFLNARAFSHSRAIEGCRQALWGFFKKMVVADNLAPIVNAAFGNPSAYNGAELALAIFCFSLQIYCDFSAYSDIATGTARLLGFDLMRNFAYPYFSQSAGEFWRRWHISLSTWFKDYVYVPLGGSRVSKRGKAVNILVTFLLSGLWHGASWNFIIWGALNGLGVLPEIIRSSQVRRTVGEKPAATVNMLTIVRILVTFLFVCLGWVFFRAATLHDAALILWRIGEFAFAPQSSGRLLAGNDVTQGRVFYAVAFLLALEWKNRHHRHPLLLDGWPSAARWAVYTVLFWIIIFLGTYGGSEFIYFQF